MPDQQDDQQSQDGQQPAQTPPWGTDEDFKPEKAWSLIQNLRADVEKYKARPTLTDEHQQQLAEAEKQRKANQTEAQRLAEESTRWQTDAQKWRGVAVQSRVEAVAASKGFADPSDAVSALSDPASFLDAGGQIDEKAINTQLDALLERKPHWRRQDGTPATPRVPAPNRAQGSGNGSAASSPAAEFAAILRGQMNGP